MRSATPEQPKQDPSLKPTSAEALIKYNAELVEGLFSSQVWNEIVLPLIQESIAGVSGRYTNGRFYKGNFTKTQDNHGWLAGYQCALEEFNNNLRDFVDAKETLKANKKLEEAEKKAPMYNPFMEDQEFED